MQTPDKQDLAPLNDEEILRVMSYNIWSDSMREKSWNKRKDMVASILRLHRPDIIGLQEAMEIMIKDLHQRLPQFDWFGVGREDGKQAGEFNAIFYRKSRLEVKNHATFWLCSEEDSIGRGWDALYLRIVTWAELCDRRTGKTLFHFNTHFDHFGRKAKLESACLLLRKVETIAKNHSVIVTGDFNCRESSSTYEMLTGKAGKQKCDVNQPFKDAIYESTHGHHGPKTTFRLFNWGSVGSARIDYIFVKNKINVLHHAVLSDEWDGTFPSDHLPVLADIHIP